MSYLISNGQLICTVSDRKSGDVIFSYSKVYENLDANREFNLVNAKDGKISNAKKWRFVDVIDIGVEINKDEYYVY